MAGAAKVRAKRERKNKSETSDEKIQKSSSSGTSKSPVSGQNVSPPSRMDGNRDPAAGRPRAGSNAGAGRAYLNKNVDFGAGLTALANGMVLADLPLRPKQANLSGKEVVVKLNTFKIEKFPTAKVAQYDVTIGNGNEKGAINTKVWKSNKLQDALGPGWIYDGKKQAWSLKKLDQVPMTITVNLDDEDGKKPKDDGKPRSDKNTFRVVIGFTNYVRFELLMAYLNNEADKHDDITASISFLDHLMRMGPSQRLTENKRKFFARGQNRHDLGQGIEAFKGVYASIHVANVGAGKQAGLSVNVDVANSAFWTASNLAVAAQKQCNATGIPQLINALAPGRNGERSPAMSNLRRLKKIEVTVKHLPDRTFKIESILTQNAEQYKFSNKDGKSMNLVQYFASMSPPIRLQYPQLPAVQMTKKNVVYPMELCNITENQLYKFKLSDKQTSEMIKFAVTLPKQRWESIEHGLSLLNWKEDQWLKNYGMQISNQPTVVNGRLLPNPKVQFGGTGPNSQVNPGQSGRWDLRNKKFIEPHPAIVNSWGWCVLPDRSGRPCITQDQLKAFIKMFIQTFTGHGGRVQNQQPAILECSDRNPATAVESIYNAAGNQVKAKPQILFFILPDKDSATYHRIKKSADCRFALVSQCMQSAHVARCQQQYASNVCMKVNAKLGGITSKAVGAKASFFTKPTVVLGIDVTHGPPVGPGLPQQPSIAAITMSFDKNAVKYVAAVETNGYRKELVTDDNVQGMVGPMLNNWIKMVGNGRAPEHIIVVRDGVSEGEYSQVLNSEVQSLKQIFQSKAGTTAFKMTVLIASKRHHVRFFPRPDCADKNGNPQPGTLVETGVTHPREYDFYLNSHSAIKGTARPVHYQVLLDEIAMPVSDLQGMLYEHSYQFVRATTPISLYPASYYAHLAAARAVAHYDEPSESEKKKAMAATGTSGNEVLAKPLVPMVGAINGTMWYV